VCNSYPDGSARRPVKDPPASASSSAPSTCLVPSVAVPEPLTDTLRPRAACVRRDFASRTDVLLFLLTRTDYLLHNCAPGVVPCSVRASVVRSPLLGSSVAHGHAPSLQAAPGGGRPAPGAQAHLVHPAAHHPIGTPPHVTAPQGQRAQAAVDRAIVPAIVQRIPSGTRTEPSISSSVRQAQEVTTRPSGASNSKLASRTRADTAGAKRSLAERRDPGDWPEPAHPLTSQESIELIA